MPYNPGISADFSPIAQGLANLGANVRQFAQKRKVEADEAKTLRRLAEIYAPEQKDRIATMGLADLRGEVQGAAITMAQKKAQMEQDRMAFDQRQAEEQGRRSNEYLALQQQFAMDAQQKQRAADQTNQAFTKFAQEYAAGPPAVLRPDLFDQANTPEGRLNYALKRNPQAAAGQNFSDFARMVQQMNRDNRNQDPRVVDLAGRKVITSPTGAFQILQDENDPKLKAANIAQLRRDRRTLMVKAADLGIDEDIKKQLLDDVSVIDDELTELGAMKRPATVKAPTDAEIKELPKSKEELVKGVIYRGRNGKAYQWVGDKFIQANP